MKPFLSRKLLVFSIAFITGILLSWFHRLDEVTSSFIIWITSAYMAGNVGKGLSDALNNKGGKSAVPNKPLE